MVEKHRCTFNLAKVGFEPLPASTAAPSYSLVHCEIAKARDMHCRRISEYQFQPRYRSRTIPGTTCGGKPQCGGSNKYPLPMFRTNMENNVYPCTLQLHYRYIKVGFEGSKLHGHVSMMCNEENSSVWSETSRLSQVVTNGIKNKALIHFTSNRNRTKTSIYPIENTHLQ